MRITLYNRQKAVQIPKEARKLIEKAARLSLKENSFHTDCEAFVTLIDNSAIQSINLEQRGIDAPTDVLSFPMLKFEGREPVIEPGDIDPETESLYLGDIMISVEKAVEQADKFGHSLERELCFLTVHGMLHLIGFDHETETDEKDMMLRQEAVLQKLGLSREQ